MDERPPLPREGDLEFDFARCPWRKIDQITFQHMKLVDFIVEEEDRRLLIEIKDPGQKSSPPKEREKWGQEGHLRHMVETSIVPKARGTYSYLHLMAEDDRPLDLIFILGHDLTDKRLRMGVLQRLRERLRQEGPHPWKRPYIREAFFIAPEDFSRVCPRFSVRRIDSPPTMV